MNQILKMFSNSTLVRQFSLNVSKKQKQNHYECLGITPKATQGDIKNAYYKLSKQYHPDINSGNASAAEKFRDIAEAYEILGNLKARKLYDRGMSMRVRLSDDSQSDEPLKENYKHASFYHQRNKPSTVKSTISGKSRFYDMDEWTRAHYSETFTSSYSKKQEGRIFVEDKTKTAKENKYYSQITAVIVMLMAVGFMYGTDPSQKFDVVQVKDISDEKPD